MESSTAPQPDKKLWTLKEVVKRGDVSISESTLRRMVKENKIDYKRIGSGRGTIFITLIGLRKLTDTDEN